MARRHGTKPLRAVAGRGFVRERGAQKAEEPTDSAQPSEDGYQRSDRMRSSQLPLRSSYTPTAP